MHERREIFTNDRDRGGHCTRPASSQPHMQRGAAKEGETASVRIADHITGDVANDPERSHRDAPLRLGNCATAVEELTACRSARAQSRARPIQVKAFEVDEGQVDQPRRLGAVRNADVITKGTPGYGKHRRGRPCRPVASAGTARVRPGRWRVDTANGASRVIMPESTGMIPQW